MMKCCVQPQYNNIIIPFNKAVVKQKLIVVKMSLSVCIGLYNNKTKICILFFFFAIQTPSDSDMN